MESKTEKSKDFLCRKCEGKKAFTEVAEAFRRDRLSDLLWNKFKIQQEKDEETDSQESIGRKPADQRTEKEPDLLCAHPGIQKIQRKNLLRGVQQQEKDKDPQVTETVCKKTCMIAGFLYESDKLLHFVLIVAVCVAAFCGVISVVFGSCLVVGVFCMILAGCICFVGAVVTVLCFVFRSCISCHGKITSL